VDFFLMHHCNCSVFFPAFVRAPWLSQAAKCRLLEWKARADIAQFVARGTPELLREEVVGYVPKKVASKGVSNGVSGEKEKATEWNALFERVVRQADDSHAAKLVRAIAHGEKVCGSGAATDETLKFMVEEDMWIKMGHMTVDSTEGQELRWVRTTGLASAWEKVPDREGGGRVSAAL
jgi:hypothetical protein